MSNPVADDILMHYGTPRHSGRYPWGSGEDPYQHDERYSKYRREYNSDEFLVALDDLRNQGLSYTEIAKVLNMSTTELKIQNSVAVNESKGTLISRCKELRAEGKGWTEIGRIVGKPEGTVRSLLNAKTEENVQEARNLANFLQQQVDEKGPVDVSSDIGLHLNVSKNRIDEALYILEVERGYPVRGRRYPQPLHPGKQTTQVALCPPGTPEDYLYKNPGAVSTPFDTGEYVSHDDGKTISKFVYPASLDSSRVKIRYAEEGGLERDGTIELRPGVEDISLGDSHYAQVRVLVDGTHYLKGMAIYSDDIPEGYDVVFNTNKTQGTPKEKVFKPIDKENPTNPFGATIAAGGQSYYTDKNGEQHLRVINKKADEGDWDEWQRGVPSQFLSKQNQDTIDNQLRLAIADRQDEYDQILKITQPEIKKYYLNTFAESCDTQARKLTAAAFPRQSYKVILPDPKLKDTEVYAPDFNNGEKIALVRYPHAGTFEIPILTVNNNVETSEKIISGLGKDAICINSTVAARLSGADYDGDTVMCIPTGRKVKIKSTEALPGLVDFDPKRDYGEPAEARKMREGYLDRGEPVDYAAIKKKTGMVYMSERDKSKYMGIVSNLITDMTLGGATSDELERAVKHSMVVIDAYKHKLNWKLSEADNDISDLKKKYQGHYDLNGQYKVGGAATLISRAKSPVKIPKTIGSGKIDPVTGKLIFKESGEVKPIRDKTGAVIGYEPVTKDAYTMDIIDDARVLSTGTPQEEAYANFANKMKAMANTARKELIATPSQQYNPQAAEIYAKEVSSLKSKLNEARKYSILERQATIASTVAADQYAKSHPEEIKTQAGQKQMNKVAQQALTNARARYKTRPTVSITDREWEAIQAGAVRSSTVNGLLTKLKKTDLTDLRDRAIPTAAKGQLSAAQINRMKSMSVSGYTLSQIAEALDVSTSTISKYLKEGE